MACVVLDQAASKAQGDVAGFAHVGCADAESCWSLSAQLTAVAANQLPPRCSQLMPRQLAQLHRRSFSVSLSGRLPGSIASNQLFYQRQPNLEVVHGQVRLLFSV